MKFVWILFLVFALNTAFAADRYFCPMHCEGTKTYEKEGTCPVCHMYLTKQGEDDAGPLNVLDYRVDLKFQFTDKPIRNELDIWITPRLTKDGSVLKELETQKGVEMEVYLTNQELHFMEYYQPKKQHDGSFHFRKDFQRTENALIFAIFKPKGAKTQIFPLAMKVELPASLKLKNRYWNGEYPGVKAKPDPFGYIVLLSEDTTYFMREHTRLADIPKQKMKMFLNAFKKKLPKPGNYRAFIQVPESNKLYRFELSK